MKIGKKHGVTLVEVIVAVLIILPVFAIVWQVLLSTRRSEKASVAMSTAIRSAHLLARTIRNDFALADLAAPEPWLAFDGARMRVITARNSENAAVIREEVIYELVKVQIGEIQAFQMKRNDRIIPNVVLGAYSAKTNGRDVGAWLFVEMTMISPTLEKSPSGKTYSHSTTYLFRAPYAPVVPGYIDYSRPLPAQEEAWIERVDGRYIVAGTKQAGTLVVQIDGQDYPLAYGVNAKDNIEQRGNAPYTRYSFNYQNSLKSLFGSGYGQRKYAVKMGTSKDSWFWENDLIPTASFDYKKNEVSVSEAERYIRGNVPYLEVFLTSTQVGRPAYIIAYRTPKGFVKTTAHQIGRGLYHATLPQFQLNQPVSAIGVAKR